VREVIAERERMQRYCTESGRGAFKIYPSHGNFLLFRARRRETHAALLAACERQRILVLDLDQQPRLALCIRVSIGSAAENQLFRTAFVQSTHAMPAR
jgi:histidinol-phosphate/aromatic aminotransferase/cobyric acid decarboxylase-like protein